MFVNTSLWPGWSENCFSSHPAPPTSGSTCKRKTVSVNPEHTDKVPGRLDWTGRAAVLLQKQQCTAQPAAGRLQGLLSWQWPGWEGSSDQECRFVVASASSFFIHAGEAGRRTIQAKGRYHCPPNCQPLPQEGFTQKIRKKKSLGILGG